MARALVNGHEVRLSAVSPDRTVQTSVMAAYANSSGGRCRYMACRSIRRTPVTEAALTSSTEKPTRENKTKPAPSTS
jgi:hypothetical protein